MLHVVACVCVHASAHVHVYVRVLCMPICVCVCMCVSSVCVSDTIYCNACLTHAYSELNIAFFMQNNNIVCLLCHIPFYTQNDEAKIRVIRHNIIKLVCSYIHSSDYN